MRYQRATVTLPLPVHRPDHWTEAASCAGPDVDPQWFDAPHEGESRADTRARIDRAKAVCAGCPVRPECDDAIVPGDSGVRAGHVVGERRYGDTVNPATPIREHGTPAGAQGHYRRGQQPCRPCRDALTAYDQERKAARRNKRKAS